MTTVVQALDPAFVAAFRTRSLSPEQVDAVVTAERPIISKIENLFVRFEDGVRLL